MELPKVLVSAPQSDKKRYCFEKWVKNVKAFTYPDYHIHLSDNSDSQDFAQEMAESYGIDITYVTNKSNRDSLMQRIADGHNATAQFCLDNNYDYLLHLETDVFPPTDVIEQLLMTGKKCIGALYNILWDVDRQLMVRTIEQDGDELRVVLDGRHNWTWVDGEVHKVFSCGLGCVLIHKSILEQTKFRRVEGVNHFPDSLWAYDMHYAGIPIYLHSGVFCWHENSHWGEYGKDYL